MKEINNTLIGVEDPDKIDFSHIEFEDKFMIEYIDFYGEKSLIRNDGFPKGLL